VSSETVGRAGVRQVALGRAVSRITCARVLVVGAGIAGLAAARALAHASFAVDMVERVTEWSGEGAGIFLPGNALRALRVLDLEKATLASAMLIPRQRFGDHRGRRLFEVDLTDMWGGVGPSVALHRADLHTVLLAGARDVPIRMGVQVRDLHQRDGNVSVEFDDGTDGEYDLVLGADGIHSSVRRLAFGSDSSVRRVGQQGWRFVTECPPEVTTWSVMLGNRTSFLTIPIGNGRVYCYCDVVSNTNEHSSDALQSLFSDFAEPVPSLIAAAKDGREVHCSTIEEAAPEFWSRGRVLLIGDAAHATSPNMAEGAAMALEDALVLAETLQQLDSIPAALAAFEARRRPRTEWVRGQTHRRDRIRYLPAALRNALVRAFGTRIFRANYRPLLDAP
jgi:2-polyprenyl-6-methoxyphenol hydroxylase-like FAD-dependent oxidoreductase